MAWPSWPKTDEKGLARYVRPDIAGQLRGMHQPMGLILPSTWHVPAAIIPDPIPPPSGKTSAPGCFSTSTLAPVYGRWE